MKSMLPVLFASVAVLSLHAADEEGMKEKMNTLIREDSLVSSKTAAPKDSAAKKPAPPPSTGNPALGVQDKPREKVVDLPALKVEASKLPKVTPTIVEARDQMRKMDETIEREKPNTVQTDTDKALNGEAVSVLGPLSSKARAEDAKRRIQETEVKQAVAACIADPNSDEENKKLLKMLQDLEYQKKHQ